MLFSHLQFEALISLDVRVWHLADIHADAEHVYF